jgi:hypothetical protein
MCFVRISVQTAIISLHCIQCFQNILQTDKLVHGFPWSSRDIQKAQMPSKIHATLRECHSGFRKSTSQFPPNVALTTTSKFPHNASFHPPMKMEKSVPKRRHIKFRRRGITQKKALLPAKIRLFIDFCTLLSLQISVPRFGLPTKLENRLAPSASKPSMWST